MNKNDDGGKSDTKEKLSSSPGINMNLFKRRLNDPSLIFHFEQSFYPEKEQGNKGKEFQNEMLSILFPIKSMKSNESIIANKEYFDNWIPSSLPIRLHSNSTPSRNFSDYWSFHPSTNGQNNVEKVENSDNEKTNQETISKKNEPQWDMSMLRKIQNVRFADTQCKEGLRYVSLCTNSESNLSSAVKDSYASKAEYYFKEALKAYPKHISTLLAYAEFRCNDLFEITSSSSSSSLSHVMKKLEMETQKGVKMLEYILKLDPKHEKAIHKLDSVNKKRNEIINQYQQQQQMMVGTLKNRQMEFNFKTQKDVLTELAIMTTTGGKDNDSYQLDMKKDDMNASKNNSDSNHKYPFISESDIEYDVKHKKTKKNKYHSRRKERKSKKKNKHRRRHYKSRRKSKSSRKSRSSYSSESESESKSESDTKYDSDTNKSLVKLKCNQESSDDNSEAKRESDDKCHVENLSNSSYSSPNNDYKSSSRSRKKRRKSESKSYKSNSYKRKYRHSRDRRDRNDRHRRHSRGHIDHDNSDDSDKISNDKNENDEKIGDNKS